MSKEDKPVAPSENKPTSHKRARHHLLNLLARKAGTDSTKSSSNRFRCKLARCYGRKSNQNTSHLEEKNLPILEEEEVRVRSYHHKIQTRPPVTIMPALPDDDSLDSGKGTSVSHSVSTEDGDHDHKVPVATTSASSADAEKEDSISSSSSIEIAVQ